MLCLEISRGERGIKGGECELQNKEHRTFDPRINSIPVVKRRAGPNDFSIKLKKAAAKAIDKRELGRLSRHSSSPFLVIRRVRRKSSKIWIDSRRAQ